MHRFPCITPFVNEVFAREKQHWDYIYLRPPLLVFYFILRTICFPLKFVLHRFPLGFEAYLIDWWMTLGMKYLARYDAAALPPRADGAAKHRRPSGQPQAICSFRPRSDPAGGDVRLLRPTGAVDGRLPQPLAAEVASLMVAVSIGTGDDDALLV